MAASRVMNSFPAFYTGTGLKLARVDFLDRIRQFVLGRGPSVLFLGENHQDPQAHALELELLQLSCDALQQLSDSCQLTLSLEFYDREAQVLLDEYSNGLIGYDRFAGNCGQLPGNHMDYKPLLDYCCQKKLPTLASNCPRRYSQYVAQHGRAGLDRLVESVPAAGALLPPLPYGQPSEKYVGNFQEIMGIVGKKEVANEKMARMLDAQSLWDASMAHSIAQRLGRQPRPHLVVHVSGYFHVKNNLGISEHLQAYMGSSEVKKATVVFLPEEAAGFNPDQHTDMADYIVLTDAKQLD